MGPIVKFDDGAIGLIGVSMILKKNVFFQDLSFDLQSEIFQEVANYMIVEEGADERFAQEEADHYINTHNFSIEYKI